MKNINKRRIASQNGRWKGGNNKCLDCSKLLSSRTVKRCKECYAKSRIGEKYPLKLITIDQLTAKFWKYVEKTEKCWEWKSCKNKAGYGKLGAGKNNSLYAHRFSYELHKGVLEKDKHIHHICGNTSCVNPEHLEQLSSKQHTLKGNSFCGIEARQTHCKHGHEFTLDNIWTYNGHRKCKKCSNIYQKELRKKLVEQGTSYYKKYNKKYKKS